MCVCGTLTCRPPGSSSSHGANSFSLRCKTQTDKPPHTPGLPPGPADLHTHVLHCAEQTARDAADVQRDTGERPASDRSLRKEIMTFCQALLLINTTKARDTRLVSLLCFHCVLLRFAMHSRACDTKKANNTHHSRHRLMLTNEGGQRAHEGEAGVLCATEWSAHSEDSCLITTMLCATRASQEEDTTSTAEEACFPLCSMQHHIHTNTHAHTHLRSHRNTHLMSRCVWRSSLCTWSCFTAWPSPCCPLLCVL